MEKKAGVFFLVKSLLIIDSPKSHLEDEVESLKSYNTECQIIHGGMIALLQFFDTHVNKLLHHVLREMERLNRKRN